MCELQSEMKIGDKGNVLLKFNAATTRDAHHIGDVSLVKLRYCTSVLLTHDDHDYQSKLVVTIPDDLPLSEAEKSVLSKGLSFVPVKKSTDEYQVMPRRWPLFLRDADTAHKLCNMISRT